MNSGIRLERIVTFFFGIIALTFVHSGTLDAANSTQEPTPVPNAPEQTTQQTGELDGIEELETDQAKNFLVAINKDLSVSLDLKKTLVGMYVNEPEPDSSPTVSESKFELARKLNADLVGSLEQSEAISNSQRQQMLDAYVNNVRSNLLTRGQNVVIKTRQVLPQMAEARGFVNTEIKRVKTELKPATELLDFIEYRISHMSKLENTVPDNGKMAIQKDGKAYRPKDFTELVAKRKEQQVGQERICENLNEQNQALRKSYKEIKKQNKLATAHIASLESELAKCETIQEELAKGELTDELVERIVALNAASNSAEECEAQFVEMWSRHQREHEAKVKLAKRLAAANSLNDLIKIEDK